MKTSVNRFYKILTCLFVILFLSSFSGCKKDDSEIKVKKIEGIARIESIVKESAFSSSDLGILNSSGLIVDAGIILFYRTSRGSYGKLGIISIYHSYNYKISFNAKTFSLDGTLVCGATSFGIRGT
jgi:hypothetical protein